MVRVERIEVAARFKSVFASYIRPRYRAFHLLLTYYQREPTFSMACATLSAYVKQQLPRVRVTLLPIFEGDEVTATARKARRLRPDLIAVSAMHPTWLPTVPYLRAIKSLLPRTPVIVGGYQGMFSPAETLTFAEVDFVCVGDGEEPLAELIRRLHKGESSQAETDVVDGLWEKKPEGTVFKSTPVLTRDFTGLPFPDYSIFERKGDIQWISPHAIESKLLLTVPVMSGRGCPYRCSYCSNTSLLELFRGKGTILRKYDPERFVNELVRLKTRYRIEYFQFWDELFTFDRKYACRLMELYRERVRLPFSIFARVEQMDDEFCRRAAEAGCHSMWFGMESGSEEYRRRYLNRKMTNERIVEAAETARHHGIKRMIFNMVGMPYETREHITETLELTRTIRPELAIFGQFLPLPGTPLYELAREAGLLLEPSAKQQMWTLGHLNIQEQPDYLTADDLSRLVDEIWQYLLENNTCER